MSAMREGFSLIEVIIAMMILSVAILAMGASAGFVIRQVHAADIRTDRAVATRAAAETIRGMNWQTLVTGCATATDMEVGDRFTVRYDCPTPAGVNVVEIRLETWLRDYTGSDPMLARRDTTRIAVRR